MASRDSICFVPGCSNTCHPVGPRFARLLCQKCRAGIPPGVYVALALQEAEINALAEHADVTRETLWEMSPKRLLKHTSRAENDRLFLDENFGDRLLLRAVAAEVPSCGRDDG